MILIFITVWKYPRIRGHWYFTDVQAWVRKRNDARLGRINKPYCVVNRLKIRNRQEENTQRRLVAVDADLCCVSSMWWESWLVMSAIWLISSNPPRQLQKHHTQNKSLFFIVYSGWSKSNWSEAIEINSDFGDYDCRLIVSVWHKGFTTYMPS